MELSRTAEAVGELNVVGLVLGGEQYVILYDDASRAQALRQLGRWASDPGLSFTWYAAAVLSQHIRERMKDAA